MSTSTRILYDLIDRRLDALGTSHPYLESEHLVPLKQALTDLRSHHALELDAVRALREVEDAETAPAVLRPGPLGGALRSGSAKRGAKK